MKILIMGTPKTGNTWIKHLLSNIYDLPTIDLDAEFDFGAIESAGPCWIGHQHWMPNQELVSWGLAHNVVFISPIRHPGDALVSLWHHIRSHRDIEGMQAASVMLRDGPDAIGENTRQFVEQDFHFYLNLSIAWTRSGLALQARYESLWDRPLEALRALTDGILPVSDDCIHVAACSCELGFMQSLLDPEKKIIRQGGVGSWQTALSPDIKRLLATLDPYPHQFAALGYTMDANDPDNAPRRTPARVPSPFGAEKRFANGVAATPIIMKAHAAAPDKLRSRWLDPRSTAEGSFYSWLNRPAAADPQAGRISPVVTELAHYIYSIRPDVRAAYPDVFGASRSAFINWFLFYASGEYGLDRAFTQQNPFPPNTVFADGTSVAHVIARAYLDIPNELRARWPDPARAGEHSFLAWLNSPAAADPFGGRARPVITELGAYLHSIRPDVAAAMPDLYCRDRLDFTSWFLVSGRKEYELDRAFTLPVIRSWTEPTDELQLWPPAASRKS